MLQNIFGNSTKFREEDITMLSNLGFTKEQAKEALKETKGNLDLAANYLFSQEAKVK